MSAPNTPREIIAAEIHVGERYGTADRIMKALREAGLMIVPAESFARIAECAFDDRPRGRVGHPSHMDWEDGYREGTQASATAIRARAGA